MVVGRVVNDLVEVRLWGRRIGAAHWDREQALATFEYDPAFLRSGIELAPIAMPLAAGAYSFPQLARETFRGLPGLLADSLPDKFGNAVIDAWLTRRGQRLADFTPLDRLCYIGTRGMGALEFQPALSRETGSHELDLADLVGLANEILRARTGFETRLTSDGPERERAMRDILQVSVSAGGARAKALIAWNADSGEVRSGQVKAPEGFSYWLLKFDGVSNRDREVFADPQGFGRIEYAYYLMARAANVSMMESRLLPENGRCHFMTRRFDRTDAGGKTHMQSLGAMRHFDFNLAGAYGYEQAMETIERLGLGMDALEEQFRRMVFNVAARNQDDHVKNIAFLMDRGGRWSLSPAFDVTFAYRADGQWTNQHQMSVNGKRDGFELEDLLTVARRFRIPDRRAREIVRRVDQAVGDWPTFAAEAEVEPAMQAEIGRLHRRFAA